MRLDPQVVDNILQFLLLISASLLGYYQYKTNRRLVQIEDTVSVAIVPGKYGKINLINTGKTNLYLRRVIMAGHIVHDCPRPRLLTAGTGEESYYWIDPPTHLLVPSQDHEATLYILDEFGNRWRAQGGLRAIPVHSWGRLTRSVQLQIWTYKTERYEWNV